MTRRGSRLPAVGSRERGIQLPLLVDEEHGGSRVDRVPELTHYQDEGCRFWRACLSCPFPQCVFDLPRGPSRTIHAYRDGEIRRMYAAGVRPVAIAEHFGITRRSVYRVLGGIRRRAPGSRESGAGSREVKPKNRSHMSDRIQLPTPDSRLPCD